MAMQSRGRPVDRLRRALTFRLLALSLLVGGGRAVRAAAAPAGLAPGEAGRVAAVLDGETVALEAGLQVRLTGILAPGEAPGDPRARDAALAERAKAALAALAAGQEVTLYYGGRRRDRYGRALAQLYRDDGLWLQGELLAAGLARVETAADNRALAAAMLAREAEAREARRGLWRYPGFAVLAPAAARRQSGRFAIVEGRVASVAKGGSRVFLRFAEAAAASDDAREGFTAILQPESRRLFTAAGLVPAALAGQRLRVRGIVGWWKGPVIDVTHPEQIELLGK